MNSARRTKLIKNRTSIIVLVLGLVVIFGMTMYIRQHNAQTFKPGPLEHVTTGNVGEYSTLSIVAKQKGIFEKNGLDVNMKEYASGPAAIADLLAHKIDTATAADFVAVSNSFHNEPIKILATQMRAYSFFLVVRSDHGIQKPADLKSKKIGITKSTAGEFYFGQFLILNKLQQHDVQVVYDTPENLVTMLTQDKLDGAVTFDPHIRDIQVVLGKKAVVWSVQSNQRLSSLLYGTNSLVKERPETVQRYLKSLLEAEDYILAHNEDARAVVGNYLKFDDAYMQTVWSRFTVDLSLDQDLLISMEDQARWAIENRLTDAKKVPDYLNLIYFDGLEAVKPDGITIIR